MSLVHCSECKNRVSIEADSCPNCGHPVDWTNINHKFDHIVQSIGHKNSINIDPGFKKTLKWFALVNGAVILSLSLTTAGNGIALIPLLLILGATFPFITLLLSKWLARRSHDIRMLYKDTGSEQDQQLYKLVDSLRTRAGLDVMPEIGVFESEEMNAFATGASRNSSLIAFSSSLLKKMDETEIAAVAAHEIAHIANGDMITMSIIQSVVNAIVLLISIPLSALKIFAIFSPQVDGWVVLLIALVKFIVVSILLFIGNLIVKAFSRKREFEADKLAAEILNKESMIKALRHLNADTDNIHYDKNIEAYAAMKISSPLSRLGDIFSTHPSIERRITALEENELNNEHSLNHTKK